MCQPYLYRYMHSIVRSNLPSRLETDAAHLLFFPSTVMAFCVKMSLRRATAKTTLMVGLFRRIAENSELSENSVPTCSVRRDVTH